MHRSSAMSVKPKIRVERRATAKPERIGCEDRETPQSKQRAERRAAPKPARIPSGDRTTYSSTEGLQ